MGRPPTQTKLSFGEDDELGAESPEEIVPKYKIGDKVIDALGLLKGVFVIDEIWSEWGDPLYCMIRKEVGESGKENTIMFSTIEEGIKKIG